MASVVVAAIGPSLNSIQPAYNPVLIYAQVLTTSGSRPPVMYADVYFNNVYYKTLTSSSVDTIVGTTSFWRFDVSGLAQEYLDSAVPNIFWPATAATAPMEPLYVAPPSIITGGKNGATLCYVKFRISSQDSYGVVTPQTPEPVQATYDTPALAGTGYASDTFTIVNAALQWTRDRSDLEASLKDYRRTGFLSAFIGQQIEATNKIYPLSHIKKGTSYANDYGQLPVLIMQNGISAYVPPGGFIIPPYYVNTAWCGIYIEMYDSTNTLIHVEFQPSGFSLTGNSIYNIPVGIKNLRVAFPGMAAYLNNCHYYQVFLFDVAPGSVGNLLFVTHRYYVAQGKNNQPADHVRLWFQNYLGHLDQLNFRVRDEDLKVTSATTEFPTITNSSRRYLRGIGRNNVRSNEYITVSDVFDEADMPVVKELLSSGQVYAEIANPDDPTGAGTVKKVLLPVVLEDADFVTGKYEDRYQYEVSFKFKMSHENRIIRN